MTDLYLLEPSPSPNWYPYYHSRPLAELRAGAWLVRERWEAVADGEAAALFAEPHLHAFREDAGPKVEAERSVDGPAIVGRSDFVPAGAQFDLPTEPVRLENDGMTVGWYVSNGTQWDRSIDTDDWSPVEIDGILLHGAYDLLTALELFLVADTLDFTANAGDPLPDGSTVIGDPHDVVILGARVEPGVTFDVRAGAVVVEQHAYVKGGTRFEGPVYVGPGTEVLGGCIGWSSFGPRCRVRGEITHCAFVGYANKAHDGFLGHSVVGRWVNLGASTQTSNLKNTYGKIRLEVEQVPLETERQFLGTLFGDHVKTAIGTLLGTGTVVGFGANVFGDVRPPKYIGPLAWGDTQELTRKEGFLATAERVMPRRNVPVDDEVKEMLGAFYENAVAGEAHRTR